MSTTKAIYVANPGAEFQEDRAELLPIITATLDRGSYILGSEVSDFEKEFAEYSGVSECIAVANGTDAISYALKGLGVMPGDEVITVSHTAVATVSAIELIGAKPVLADIDSVTRCMCPLSLKKLITPNVKAIVAVHIYGQPAAIKEILEIADKHNIPVVEDCAQAHGATVDLKKVGSFAPIAAFSFYPTKNLGALGDGGAIIVRDNVELAEKVRALRQYGWKERYISIMSGGNSRLDELQAAILRYRLKKLDQRNRRRQEIAKFYNELLVNYPVGTPQTVPGTTHVMHQYVITSLERDQIKEFLGNNNIFAALHYPQAVHQQPAYLGKLRGSNELAETEILYRSILSLPVYPQLSDSEVEYIGHILKKYWS